MKWFLIVLLFLNCSTKHYLLNEGLQIDSSVTLSDELLEANWKPIVEDLLKDFGAEKLIVKINFGSTSYNAYYSDGTITINKKVLLYHHEQFDKGACGESDRSTCKKAMLAFLIAHEIKHYEYEKKNPEKKTAEHAIDVSAATMISYLIDKNKAANKKVPLGLYYSSLQVILDKSPHGGRDNEHAHAEVRKCAVSRELTKNCDHLAQYELSYAFALIINTEYFEKSNNDKKSLDEGMKILQSYINIIKLNAKKIYTKPEQELMLKELEFMYCLASTKLFFLTYYPNNDIGEIFYGLDFSNSQVFNKIQSTSTKETAFFALIKLYKDYLQEHKIELGNLKQDSLEFHHYINFGLLLELVGEENKQEKDIKVKDAIEKILKEKSVTKENIWIYFRNKFNPSNKAALEYYKTVVPKKIWSFFIN
jgi:hypothetical protein